VSRTEGGRALGDELLERRDGVVRAQTFQLADVRPDPPHDAAAFGLALADRGKRLLALDGVLFEVRGKAMQAEAHVDVVVVTEDVSHRPRPLRERQDPARFWM
jgi:hypothetical protein